MPCNEPPTPRFGHHLIFVILFPFCSAHPALKSLPHIFLLLLAVIFIGMGVTVLTVVFGNPPANVGDKNYRDNLLTVGPPCFLLLLVLILGLYLPEPLRRLCTDAAALVEVQP